MKRHFVHHYWHCPECGGKIYWRHHKCRHCGWHQYSRQPIGLQVGDQARYLGIIEKVSRGLSMAQIAREDGVSRQRMNQLFRKLGLSDYYHQQRVRKMGEESYKNNISRLIKCPVCGRLFMKLRGGGRTYCSEKCALVVKKKRTREFMKYYHSKDPRGRLYMKAYLRIRYLKKKAEAKLDKST